MKQYNHLKAPLLSLVILTLGSAFLTTLLSLQMHAFGANNFLIGALSTAYYGGMIAGAFQLGAIILRVGHIRFFSACASILSVAALLHAFYSGPYWILLRFIEGIATAGLYIVIESWILSSTTSAKRGASLALYMIALYLAQSLGQWLLNIHSDNFVLLCAVSSALASLSVVPLSLTKTPAPSFSEPEPLTLAAIFRLCPSGVMTCFVSGLILGSLYGLFPVYIKHLGFSTSSLSTVMALIILGGMLFQYPWGKLSDLISRRYVIAMLSFMTAILSLIFLLTPHFSLLGISLLSFLLGSVTFCLYPVGISHSCDRVDDSQVVSATQTLLLAYGAGATLGPVLAPACHLLVPNKGAMLFMLITALPLSLFILWRKTQASSVALEDKQGFALAVEMTPVSFELDPRVDQD